MYRLHLHVQLGWESNRLYLRIVDYLNQDNVGCPGGNHQSLPVSCALERLLQFEMKAVELTK